MESEVKDTLFVRWVRAMGYNGKQIGKAHESIGYGARAELQFKDDLPDTVLLAMSARRAGLPPWSPENDAAIASLIPTVAADLRKAAMVLSHYHGKATAIPKSEDSPDSGNGG